MISNLKLAVFGALATPFLFNFNASGQTCSLPRTENFSSITDNTYTKKVIDLNCLRYFIDGTDGAIAIDNMNSAAFFTPAFSGNIMVLLDGGSQTTTQCGFQTIADDNFKLNSVTAEFFGHTNANCAELYNIIGYADGQQKARVDAFNVTLSGVQGSGGSTVNFVKNAYNTDGSNSGVINFTGTAWQNIDKVVFEVAEVSQTYRTLYIGLDDVNIGLPIVVTPLVENSFTVRANVNNVDVKWIASNNNTGVKYKVSRSVNGIDYSDVFNVEAAIGTKNYSFVDAKPIFGTSYYKLEEVDQNGLLSTLGVKQVNYNLSGSSVVIYPNPTKDFVIVNSDAGIFTDAEITAINGKSLIKEKINEGFLKLDLRSLPKGTYILMLSGKNNVQTKKVIKL